MKIRHAEMLFRRMRRNKTLTEPLTIITEEGVMFTGLPMGMAEGSVSRDIMIDRMPRRTYSALYHGAGEPHHMFLPKMAKGFLWNQEEIIYLQEKRAALNKALTELNKRPVLSTGGSYVFIPDPEIIKSEEAKMEMRSGRQLIKMGKRKRNHRKRRGK